MAVTAVSSVNTSGTLSAAGVGSGLDVQGMVSKLMEVERLPLTKLAAKEAKYQAKLSSLGSIGGALSSLQTAAQALKSASAVKNSASSSNTSVLTATAGSDALPGKYSVTLTKLAQAQKLLAGGRSSTSAVIGGGALTTLSFTLGTISSVLGPDADGYYTDATFAADTSKTPISVSINSSNNTLAGIRDAINAAAAGVTASIINDGGGAPYRLTIASNASGIASSLQIAVSGESEIATLLAYDPQTATQNLRQTQVARNAELSIDGVSITSAANTVAEAIQGVTLNLAQETAAGSPVSITVQRDSGSLISSLSALVRAYNSANSAIAGATAKGAVLQGDSGVLGLQRQVIAILGSVQATGGSYTTLSSLGISFQQDATLAFDTSKASAALTADFAGVADLTSAIGDAIHSAATNLLGDSGPIAAESDGINRSIKDIASRRSGVQYRLELMQQRYLKQFSALDTLISSMNATSSYLTQQLDAIASLNKQD
jgi:flagellar hook-associated protein 2